MAGSPILGLAGRISLAAGLSAPFIATEPNATYRTLPKTQLDFPILRTQVNFVVVAELVDGSMKMRLAEAIQNAFSIFGV
jgi:hypothetical protein